MEKLWILTSSAAACDASTPVTARAAATRCCSRVSEAISPSAAATAPAAAAREAAAFLLLLGDADLVRVRVRVGAWAQGVARLSLLALARRGRPLLAIAVAVAVAVLALRRRVAALGRRLLRRFLRRDLRLLDLHRRLLLLLAQLLLEELLLACGAKGGASKPQRYGLHPSTRELHTLLPLRGAAQRRRCQPASPGRPERLRTRVYSGAPRHTLSPLFTPRPMPSVEAALCLWYVRWYA
eukprot:scaffold57749_cov63-Phaeocystis_antarctica.AAC.2